MGLEGSLSYSKESATGTCVEPVESSPCHNILISAHLRIGLPRWWSLPLFRVKCCIHFSFLIHVTCCVHLILVTLIVFNEAYTLRSCRFNIFLHSSEVSSLLDPNAHLSTEYSNTFNSIHEIALPFLSLFASSVWRFLKFLFLHAVAGCYLLVVHISTYYIAPYDRTVVNTELERMRKKVDVS